MYIYIYDVGGFGRQVQRDHGSVSLWHEVEAQQAVVLAKVTPVPL